MYSGIARRKPLIGPNNRSRRVRWCEITLPWTVGGHWDSLVLSDENRFTLSFCDGRVRVWRTQGEWYLPPCMSATRINNCTPVMVWGCIRFHGVGELVVLIENVNAVSCVQILRNNLLTSVDNIFGDNTHPFIFQHDNVPPTQLA